MTFVWLYVLLTDHRSDCLTCELIRRSSSTPRLASSSGALPWTSPRVVRTSEHHVITSPLASPGQNRAGKHAYCFLAFDGHRTGYYTPIHRLRQIMGNLLRELRRFTKQLDTLAVYVNLASLQERNGLLLRVKLRPSNWGSSTLLTELQLPSPRRKLVSLSSNYCGNALRVCLSIFSSL